MKNVAVVFGGTKTSKKTTHEYRMKERAYQMKI
jgi:hypothetical protein